MILVEEFGEIIKNGKEIELVNFLKSMTQEERSVLRITILDLFQRESKISLNETKKYFKNFGESIGEIEEIHDDILTPVKLEYQKILLSIAHLVCNEEHADIPEPYFINFALEAYDKYNISSWCFPNLFCEDNYYTYNDYKKLLKCMEINQKNYTNEDIATSLSRTTFNKVSDIQKITLNEHIWYLFQYETDIHNQYDGAGDYWIQALKELITNTSLDKLKVMEEALLSSVRFTNRTITGYFFKMLETLNPAGKELLQLQDTLCIVLQGQHSKPINQTLKYIKLIHKEPDFNLQGVMEQVPLLLSWDVKAVVNGTLSLIDALIKAHSKHKEALALLAVQTLGQEDESLQTKAVKLLAKHKLLQTSSILDEINMYNEGLYHSTKQLLPTLDTVVVEKEYIEIAAPKRIREDNYIPTYESFDELVFFFSQVFEQNNVYDFDLFIDLLPKLNTLINEENINKLSPVFALAEKAYIHQISNENSNTISHVVSLISLTFLEFMLKHKSIFSKDLNLLYTKSKLLCVNSEGAQTWFPIKDIKKAIDSSSLEAVHARLLVNALQNRLNIPLLSIPTHTPCWIDSKSFILLLKEYQDSDWNIASYDIQIALSRVVLDKDSIQMIKNELHGELKDLLLYLFTDMPLQLNQITNPEYWLVAVLRRGNENDAKIFTLAYSKDKTEDSILALSTWKAYREPWEYDDWEKGVKVKKSIMSPKLSMQRRRIVPNLTFDSIFKHTSTRYSYDMISKYDSGTFLLFTPTLPHFLLENLLAKIASSYESSYVKRTTENIITLLLDIWDEFNATSYLFVVYILTSEDKTARILASELWNKATTEGTMNHKLLGQILGKLEHNEYAPLKRFTDLIVANMLNISTLHNQGLHILLSNMIISMNDEPIKGTKKLLEIYLEVLNSTKMGVSNETLEKFKVWGKTKSLRTVIKKFEDMKV